MNAINMDRRSLLLSGGAMLVGFALPNAAKAWTEKPVAGDEVASFLAIDAQGISYPEVTELLEKEGVEKFEAAWGDLLSDLSDALDAAK